MGKKLSKAGAELRRAIRADIDANPGIDHKTIRSKYATGEHIVKSAMMKTVAEWDAVIAYIGDSEPIPSPESVSSQDLAMTRLATSTSMPGLEQGIIKFARKPAKMGADYIFWIPRVYIKNGLVDPTCEYVVYLQKKGRMIDDAAHIPLGGRR
ncbi:MAG: hypothetical protein GYA24_21945 [Candidatus Lokiarchaeota archaeon]|nr:hypothetical protein [Candidatus Lokiarchaeota archaeon]